MLQDEWRHASPHTPPGPGGTTTGVGRALHRRVEVRQPGLGEPWCSIWLGLAAATASRGVVQVAAGEHCVAGLRRVQGRRDGPVRLPSQSITRRLVVFIVTVASGVLWEDFVWKLLP